METGGAHKPANATSIWDRLRRGPGLITGLLTGAAPGELVRAIKGTKVGGVLFGDNKTPDRPVREVADFNASELSLVPDHTREGVKREPRVDRVREPMSAWLKDQLRETAKLMNSKDEGVRSLFGENGLFHHIGDITKTFLDDKGEFDATKVDIAFNKSEIYSVTMTLMEEHMAMLAMGRGRYLEATNTTKFDINQVAHQERHRDRGGFRTVALGALIAASSVAGPAIQVGVNLFMSYGPLLQAAIGGGLMGVGIQIQQNSNQSRQMTLERRLLDCLTAVQNNNEVCHYLRLIHGIDPKKLVFTGPDLSFTDPVENNTGWGAAQNKLMYLADIRKKYYVDMLHCNGRDIHAMPEEYIAKWDNGDKAVAEQSNSKAMGEIAAIYQRQLTDHGGATPSREVRLTLYAAARREYLQQRASVMVEAARLVRDKEAVKKQNEQIGARTKDYEKGGVKPQAELKQLETRGKALEFFGGAYVKPPEGGAAAPPATKSLLEQEADTIGALNKGIKDIAEQEKKDEKTIVDILAVLGRDSITITNPDLYKSDPGLLLTHLNEFVNTTKSAISLNAFASLPSLLAKINVDETSEIATAVSGIDSTIYPKEITVSKKGGGIEKVRNPDFDAEVRRLSEPIVTKAKTLREKNKNVETVVLAQLTLLQKALDEGKKLTDQYEPAEDSLKASKKIYDAMQKASDENYFGAAPADLREHNGAPATGGGPNGLWERFPLLFMSITERDRQTPEGKMKMAYAVAEAKGRAATPPAEKISEFDNTRGAPQTEKVIFDTVGMKLLVMKDSEVIVAVAGATPAVIDSAKNRLQINIRVREQMLRQVLSDMKYEQAQIETDKIEIDKKYEAKVAVINLVKKRFLVGDGGAVVREASSELLKTDRKETFDLTKLSDLAPDDSRQQILSAEEMRVLSDMQHLGALDLLRQVFAYQNPSEGDTSHPDAILHGIIDLYADESGDVTSAMSNIAITIADAIPGFYKVPGSSRTDGMFNKIRKSSSGGAFPSLEDVMLILDARKRGDDPAGMGGAYVNRAFDWRGTQRFTERDLANIIKGLVSHATTRIISNTF